MVRQSQAFQKQSCCEVIVKSLFLDTRLTMLRILVVLSNYPNGGHHFTIGYFRFLGQAIASLWLDPCRYY